MGYQIELKNFSLQNYKELIRNQNLLPRRKILQEDLDARFDAIQQADLGTVFELKSALSTPGKLIDFASKTGLSEEYLIILRREIGSLEQKPVSLSDFPGIDTGIIEKLSCLGIKTSKDYYDFYTGSAGFTATDEKEISKAMADELYTLSNLVRINGIGAVAAKAFFEAGFHTVADVANAAAHEMLTKVTAVNAEKQYYKAKLGEKDMQFCIDFAGILMNF